MRRRWSRNAYESRAVQTALSREYMRKEDDRESNEAARWEGAPARATPITDAPGAS